MKWKPEETIETRGLGRIVIQCSVYKYFLLLLAAFFLFVSKLVPWDGFCCLPTKQPFSQLLLIELYLDYGPVWSIYGLSVVGLFSCNPIGKTILWVVHSNTMFLCKYLIEGYVDGLTVANEDGKELCWKFLETIFNLMENWSPSLSELGAICVRMYYMALQQPSCTMRADILDNKLWLYRMTRTWLL